MTNKLNQLRKMTVVVADTGDLEAVVNHRPEDCTTNPSIVLKTCTSPKFAATFAEAVSGGKGKANPIRAIATDLTISVGASLSATFLLICKPHSPVRMNWSTSTPHVASTKAAS
jgi:transaldolase